MTLFDFTSFYVTLFVASFVDIFAFMILLVAILSSFMAGLMIVDHNHYNQQLKLSKIEGTEQEYHDLI